MAASGIGCQCAATEKPATLKADAVPPGKSTKPSPPHHEALMRAAPTGSCYDCARPAVQLPSRLLADPGQSYLQLPGGDSGKYSVGNRLQKSS